MERALKIPVLTVLLKVPLILCISSLSRALDWHLKNAIPFFLPKRLWWKVQDGLENAKLYTPWWQNYSFHHSLVLRRISSKAKRLSTQDWFRSKNWRVQCSGKWSPYTPNWNRVAYVESRCWYRNWIDCDGIRCLSRSIPAKLFTKWNFKQLYTGSIHQWIV